MHFFFSSNRFGEKGLPKLTFFHYCIPLFFSEIDTSEDVKEVKREHPIFAKMGCSLFPDNKVRDFVGIEFQTLDTTGTVYPERQRLLQSFGIEVSEKDVTSKKKFGMNWKMTAKTILVQLHHKIDTFEHIGKHLVLEHRFSNRKPELVYRCAI